MNTRTITKRGNVAVDFNVSIQVKSPRHPWEDLTFFIVSFSVRQQKSRVPRVPA